MNSWRKIYYTMYNTTTVLLHENKNINQSKMYNFQDVTSKYRRSLSNILLIII